MELQMVQGGTTYGQSVAAAPVTPAEPLPAAVQSQEDLDAIDVGEEAPSEEASTAEEDLEAPEQPMLDPGAVLVGQETNRLTVVDDMMDLLIDDAMRVRLHAAIRSTPHEGFRPTLKITERGEVLLEFLPL